MPVRTKALAITTIITGGLVVRVGIGMKPRAVGIAFLLFGRQAP